MKNAPLILICSLLNIYSLQAITIVYNLRIAQITRRQISLGKPNLVVNNLFQQWYKFGTGLKQSDIGLLTSFIRTGPSWYAKMDIAGAHVHNVFADGTRLTRNQTDDIFLSGGYGIQPREGTKITFSGHAGIPTHRDTILDGIQFGTGHFALGAQVDGSQAYHVSKPHFVFFALRLIHFFPRTIGYDNPVVQPQRYNLALGNLTDIYIAHQSNWDMRHRIEFGYNVTFGFGARICPLIANFNAAIAFIRNSYFFSFARRIKVFNKPSALLFTFSYGFDSRPRLIGRKYIVTVVGSWAINF
jgi:hypothetical protein